METGRVKGVGDGAMRSLLGLRGVCSFLCLDPDFHRTNQY